MTHVHYKFSSKLSYDTVVFDGPHITLRDLKRQIMGREKLRSGDCDLQITNAQTQEEYTDDEGQIHKGSSVIVRRIPIIGHKSSSNSKTRNVERLDVQLHHPSGAAKAMDEQSASRALPLFSKMANLANADVPEEDKLKVILNQSTFDTTSYTKKSSTVLPANYTCYRCGLAGHHIRNCPTSGQDKGSEAPLRLKKSTGIPRSFMVEVDDPNIKGVMMTNCGHYAIPAIHAKAYAIGKKEKPPFEEQPESEEKEDPVPDELLCLICRDLLSDAVLIPCCGNSYCDDCIRTTLLDSEDHVCPTCNQSDVSPDTLIANKFLRQAVNTFKKERGHNKSLRGRCGTSQSQNPTPTPSPVPTPPPLTVHSQPHKSYQSTRSQQDPLLHHAQAAETPPPPPSQVCGAPLAAAGPTPASDTPSTSLQPPQSHLQPPDKEAEEKTPDDSSAAAPSVLVSHKDPAAAAAASQLIPLVNHTPAGEQPQTASVNLQQTSSGPASRHSGPSTCWSSSSSSTCPTGGWSDSSTLQPPPSSASSSYPTAPPPLFPSPHFHAFLAAQQPLGSYPPGYPPATPVWTFPPPQSAPIPSLCSSTSASLIPQEWYMHQRKKKERSPHRGSSYRRSSSRSNSKSSKSKSSRSYSRSSSRSRSRSRSRSQGRSRPHSPYARHRDLHTRSHSSHSYSYGYKRSPTPSSSSSPRVGYRSRSKSPSDCRKNSHHSRHRNKKSTSSSYSSRRREGRSQREAGGSGGSSDSYLYAQQANQTSSLELDRERYLKWKMEYKEWCEKYFSSYVGHFHHLPPPLLSLPPSPLPQWGDKEGSSNHSKANSEFCNRLQGRRAARTDRRSPPSQSSSDSRSPPSQSSSDSRSPPSQSSGDSRSTPSQSSSDSRSSPSHSSNDSRSPPSRSSSGGRSTPAKDGARPRACQQRCAEKYSSLPITLTKSSEGVELQERRRDDKQLITKTSINLSTLKHGQKSIKKHEEGREDSSSPDAADSMDDCRKDRRRHNAAPNACKDSTRVQDKSTASEALESARPIMKPDKHLDKDSKRKSGEQRNLEKERSWRRGKHSDSRQDVERRHKEKPSKGTGRVDTDRCRSPGGSKASDSRSEKNRKRKGEDVERSSVKAQSSKCLKTNLTEVPETHKSESPNPFDRKKPKTERQKERKTWPLPERDIWEEGIKVKPQKKISININLDGKRTEEKTSYLESITGKTKEENEKTGNGEEDKLNRGGAEVEVNEKNEQSRDQKGVPEEKIKPDEGEARSMWEKVTFKDDKRDMRETKGRGKKEDRGEEDFDLWHCALRGVEEEKEESEKRDKTEASKAEEVTNDRKRSVTGGKDEERRVRDDGGGQDTRELVAGSRKERPEGESTRKENRSNQPEEAKPKVELMEWRMRKEEDTGRSKAQRSRNESLHDGPNSTVEDGSYEEHQERKTVVKTLEEYSRNRAAFREDELILIQVPRSKWEKEESEEEEKVERQIKVQTDALAAFLPSSSVSVTAETPSGNEEQRHRETERDRARGKDEERDRNSTLSSSQRSVAPSSGKDRPDSPLTTERNGERRMEMERPRGRQKESNRSKEREREGEKGGDREREGRHSSSGSTQKRDPPSSSHSYSYSTSHDTERRDRQRGGDQDGNKTPCSPGGKSSNGRSWKSSVTSRAADPPSQTYRDTLLGLKFTDRYHSRHYHNPQDPSGNYRHQDRPAGTHQSPPPYSHSWGRERDLPLSESCERAELGKPRMSSPDRELMQNRSRNESKGGWKRNKVDKGIKEGKGERENQEMVHDRGGGGRWEDEADKLDGQTRWEGGRELEEGQRPSSNSVSESSSDERGKDWKRKQKEQRTPVPEEEGELRKSRDGREEGSSAGGEDKWKEDHCAQLRYLTVMGQKVKFND
ncbi:E3 ubiquitin-protein ligase RBBP6 isoform X2 [Chelmon rostratus]|uniref:E3 ubiquitin-protein ligase RBBP6 isoform X2 n=1 Tax=Chelmon rostratus TaxID=109905 RepID=UPI001BE87DA5|nr:E3 ubiquitin-protein ligase RBBP6 isoform X2 [Chelmon rostratus]